uniref:Uncharacterized protein n=1 Tax=Anopheles culicifacies TaxID=139723 RepID=A0A182LSR5_9DIPT
MRTNGMLARMMCVSGHRKEGEIVSTMRPIPASIDQVQRIAAKARLILRTTIEIAQIKVKVSPVRCRKADTHFYNAALYVLLHNISLTVLATELVTPGPGIAIVISAHATLAVVRTPLYLESTTKQLVVRVVG